MHQRKFLPPPGYPEMTRTHRNSLRACIDAADKGEVFSQNSRLWYKFQDWGLVVRGPRTARNNRTWTPSEAGRKLWAEFLRFTT